jgi:asparagine synthase (glutamine-hydrolysing)
MCGIAGFYSFNKIFSEKDLKRMTDSMAHRGPDADGFYIDPESGVGLGHRRLSILDLSNAANQPMQSQCGRYYISFNGEVYNFNEISQTLNIKSRTTSDTEVILEAFVKRGVDFVHLLNGMFAIAIYDSLHKVLYIFRDRLGIKPVAYYWQDGNFAFSSEIKALLTLDEISKSKSIMDKGSIYTFLYAGFIPEPHTIYKNISRLPSGSYAIIKEGKMEIKSYWKPEDKITAKKTTDFKTAKETLKWLLENSVRYRMISDVPFGVFLSGGIDSSTIAAIAQNISTDSIKTFSIGVKDNVMDESGFARNVSQYLKTEHYEFMVSEQDSLELVDKILTAYDEPYADSSAIPTMLVSKLARQHVTMALTGDGGDELFMGYGAYAWAERLNNPLIKLFRGPIGSLLSRLNNTSKRASGIFDYSSEKSLKSHIFSQEQYFFSENELNGLLTKDFISPLLFDERLYNLNRRLSAKEEQALFDIKNYLKDDLLVKVDIASMQFSLEARTPFLDYNLVEFALNLDEKYKVHNGVSKYLLKQVLYEYVPENYFDRPKKGFSIPLAKWLRTDLKYLIDDYLSKASIEQAGFVNYDRVIKIIDRFEKGEDYLFNRLWALILLHKWAM